MNRRLIVRKTENHIKPLFIHDTTGHDWYHLDRVRNIALVIAKKTKGADFFIVELAALLHDLGDYKFNKGQVKGGIMAQQWLRKIGADSQTIISVANITQNVSYKGALVRPNIKSIEGKIVWDADKLDALGAIGIARTFAYGGKVGVKIYDPKQKPVLHKTFKAYKSNNSSTVNHFYEKLLLLKDKMFTQEGKRLAKERHVFMERYLKQFYKEWGKFK